VKSYLAKKSNTEYKKQKQFMEGLTRKAKGEAVEDPRIQCKPHALLGTCFSWSKDPDEQHFIRLTRINC
jgi:hypothetical protein